ncbi:hypothetical protein NVP1031O_102 [Vibrio phage 1.031.O._10N.261.46.F8]|nr:hypothetical protein NVP1031O_102 [Vibrio phage 1.031.O._10N.261.46.F8]
MSNHTYFDVLRITTNTGDITSIAHRNIMCIEYVSSEGNMYVRFGEGDGSRLLNLGNFDYAIL